MPRLRSQTLALPRAQTYHWLQAIRQLSRAELSATVALSALAGRLLAAGNWTSSVPVVMLGVLLLAAGCSALNQWQEQDLDARMHRTCRRPLPAGHLSPAAALMIAGGSIAGGLLLLGLLPGVQPLLLGLLAVIWYNAIYTPLKRYTPFAALPGAICGALPPLIGWAATGQSLFDARILILAGTLFVWQIPHSWLLLCHYRQDLKRSGLPDLFEKIPTSRLLQINNCWLAALGLCYLLFPLFGLIRQPTLVGIFLSGIALLYAAILRESTKKAQRIEPLRLFHLLNLSLLMLFMTLIFSSILTY